jgi:hypothetical protein
LTFTLRRNLRAVDDATAEKIARNNAAFRAANDEIAAAADDHGLADGRVVPFLCECSDGRCSEVIHLTLVEYSHVRSNPRWFAHARGHEAVVEGAVQLLEEHPGYLVVEKIGHAGTIASRLAPGPPT